MQMQSPDHISKKKFAYPVSKSFKKYLKRYGREISLPVSYEMLRHFDFAIPVTGKDGKDTFWETVFYNPSLTDEIHASLKRIYSLLKSSGNTQAEDLSTRFVFPRELVSGRRSSCWAR